MTTTDKIAAYVDGQAIPEPSECFAIRGQIIIDVINPGTGLTAIYGKTLEDCRAEKGYEQAERMTIDEFCQDKAAQDAPGERKSMNYTVKFTKRDRVIKGEGFISNGHWAVRDANCMNALVPTGEAPRSQYNPFTRECGPLKAFQGTKWCINASKHADNVRVFKAEDGMLAAFDRDYLKMFRRDDSFAVLWGVSPKEPFFELEDKAASAFVLMPVSVGVKSLPKEE